MGGKMLNLKGQSDKKSKNIIGIIQSCLILVLVILIIFMMIQISWLQGTARVINYAGLVRGATQREVKLEITGNQNDELIKYLDDILLGLRYQDGHYDLVKLNDEEYQEKLQIQSDYWDKLKTEIEAVRNKGYENTDIVNMSEIYFTMADETVSAAESYSEKIAVKIRTIELLSALDMLSLVILVIMQTLKAMQMAMQNRLLEQKAFVDAHTGLPNKNACNELLNKKDIITDSTACIMFDLNNLKTVNDTMGPVYVTDEVIDSMSNGAKDIAVVYSGDAAYILDQNEDMAYCQPKQGTNVWTDAMVIPKNAENPELANVFINFILEDKESLDNSQTVGYASSNQNVLNELSEGDYAENEAYLPRSGYDKDEYFHDNETLRAKLSELWIKIKAGN